MNGFDFSFFIKDADKKAKSLVRKIVHSGEQDLNKDDLLELKKICRASNDETMLTVHKECFSCLRKEHSQVRVSSVKLLDYLFRKSHILREKVLDDMNLFLELTLAISAKPKIKLALPPPKKFASLLQELTAKVLHAWHADFGPGYEKLRYTHKHLKEHRLVDFGQFRVRTQEDLIKQQKIAKEQEKILTRAIETKLRSLGETRQETEQLLTQIQSTLDLLVEPQEQLLRKGDQGTEGNSNSNLNDHQKFGIANLNQTLEIELNPYVELVTSDENKEIVQTLRELKKELVEAKLPRLISIEKTISKRSENFVDHIKCIIDLKSKAMNIVMKLSELKIIDQCDKDNCKRGRPLDEASNSDSFSDFEDVGEKEDMETYIPLSMREEYGLEPIDRSELNKAINIPLIKEATVHQPEPSTSKAIACNVELDSGKLCPRRDTIRCPFHGKIIPRDEFGQPLSRSERLKEKESRKKITTVPDWQDPELLNEIRVATGVDLTMPRKGQGKRNPDRPRVSEAKKADITPKQRLQKRLRMLSK